MSEAIELRSKLTSDQIELVKRTVAKGATNDELQLFLYQAQKTGLDPLARQIHCVKRGGQCAIQTGIDGYRLIADRTGKYAGNGDPVFTWENTESEDKHPLTATVTITKIIGQKPDGTPILGKFTATADWGFYKPKDGQDFMWQKGKGKFMLAKCAEALALRKAFPSELSGVYTDDEMHQAGNGDSAPTQTHTRPAGREVKPTPKPQPKPAPAGKELFNFDPDDLDGDQLKKRWYSIAAEMDATRDLDVTKRYPVMSSKDTPLSMEWIQKVRKHDKIDELRDQMKQFLADYRSGELDSLPENDEPDPAHGQEPPPHTDDDLPF